MADPLTTGCEIYNSADGKLIENRELKTIIDSLQDLTGDMVFPIKQKRSLTLSKTDKLLKDLCDRCNDVSKQLMEVIRGLMVQGEHKRWNSFRQVLNSVWKEDEIEALSARLEKYRRQIDTTLLVSLREQIHEQGLGSNKHTGREIQYVLGSIEEIK